MAENSHEPMQASGTDEPDGQEVEVTTDNAETIKYNTDEQRLKLIILFLNEGSPNGREVSKECKGTEEKKFDIVYQKSVDDQRITQFIDNIYLDGPSGDRCQIQYSDLHEDQGRFSLKKYFRSYITLKKLDNYKDDIIDIVIWTNVQLDDKYLRSHNVFIEKLPEKEYENLIYHPRTKEQCGNGYQIVSVGEDFLREMYEVSSEFYALVKVIFNTAFFPKAITSEENDVFLSYQEVLISENVIEKAENSFWKFTDNFTTSPESLQSNAREIRKSVWMKKLEIPQAFPNVPIKEVEFWKVVANCKFEINQSQVIIKPKEQLPIEQISDKDLVQEFLSHFIFVNTTKVRIFESISVLGITTDTSERNLENGNFFDNVEELSKQLCSPNPILFCISESTGLAFIKTAQILKLSSSSSPTLFYSVLNVGNLLTKKSYTEVIFDLTEPYTLVVEINLTNQELTSKKADDYMKKLCEKPDPKQNQRIVFLLRQDSKSLVSTWINEQPFTETNLTFAFEDLTNSTQTRLLQKKVTFQGIEISLGELIKDGKLSLVTEEMLEKLINEIPIVLGLSLGDNLVDVQDYYIKRNFEHANRFSANSLKDTFKGQNVIIFNDTTDSNEKQEDDNQIKILQKFFRNEETCKGKVLKFRKTEHNDETDNSQIFEWQNPDETNIVQRNIAHDKLTVISGDSGMGKSSVLAKIALTMKHRNPDHWIVYVSLRKHSSDLTKIQNHWKKQKTCANMKIRALIKFLIKVENLAEGIASFDRKLLTERVTQTGQISVLLDGFDEICPVYKDIVMAIIDVMKRSKIEQVWVTTRPEFHHLFNTEFSYTLKPYKDNDRQQFITKYKKVKKFPTNPDEENKFENWLKNVQSRNGKALGNALHAKLTVDIYYNRKQQPTCKFCSSNFEFDNPSGNFSSLESDNPSSNFSSLEVDSTSCDCNCLDVYSTPWLYEQFTEQKLSTFFIKNEKSDNASTEKERFDLNRTHQRYALRYLFPEKYKLFFPNPEEYAGTQTWALQLGIVTMNSENISFIHRTFADYFLANFFVDQLTSKREKLGKEKMSFLSFEPLKHSNKQIREFMDYFLVKGSEIHQAVIADNFEILEKLVSESENDDIRKIDQIGRTPLHLACLYKRREMVEFLKNTDKYLMRDLDNLGFGPLCYAAVKGDEFLMKNMLKFVVQDEELSKDDKLLNTFRQFLIIYNEKY